MSPEIEFPADRLAEARARVAAARRVVVKVGTNVVMADDGTLALGRLYGLIEAVAGERRHGREMVVVSSGAVGLGAQRLDLAGRPKTLALKQACAAIGQGRLMSIWSEAFEKVGVIAAQVLLTEDDFSSRSRYLALRATLEELLSLGVVPVLNENDTVGTAELEAPAGHVFGDNDKLSALVMSKIGADLLLVLSDVDALYTGNPARDRSARRVPLVAEVSAAVLAYADGGGARGRGGMRTKLEAAAVATASGGLAVIASGRTPGIVEAVLRGDDTGTVFLPRTQLTGRRRWIAYAALPSGDVFVNDGAREAIARRKASLLPAGVTRLAGEFEAGDVVVLRAEDGTEFARGIVNYGSDDAGRLVGRQSGDIDRLVARRSYDALVTRNNIVLREPPAGVPAP
jgi:glutamate 5-kinase